VLPLCAGRYRILQSFRSLAASPFRLSFAAYDRAPTGRVSTMVVGYSHLSSMSLKCVILCLILMIYSLDILESLAGHQETAYEKLYKWTQRECQSSFNREFLEISSLMKRATQALKHKPVLFQYVQNFAQCLF
jgi:Conserved oligomeric complex COG6